MAERPSSIDRLPSAIQDEIASLRGAGHTLDEILAALRQLHDVSISRSALGRHVKNMEEVTRDMRQSRDIAEMLVRQYGDAPENRMVQANIHLMHSVIMRLFTNEPEALAELAKNPAGVMMMAKALDHLTRSSKTDIEHVAKIEARVEARMRKEASDGIAQVARQKGLSAETVAAIRAQILGVS